MYGLILFMMKVFVDGDNLCLIFNSIFPFICRCVCNRFSDFLYF
jgi:hypothetical protein